MFLFDNKLTNLKQVINNNNLIECNLIQEINKAGQLSFIADLSLYKKIDDGDMIVVHDKDDEYLLFRVVKKEALNDRCSILAVEYGYYCLSVVDYIKDYRPKDKSFQSVLKEILKNTGWTLGKVDNFSNYTGTFYYQTPLECLSVLGEAKGCEFKFTVSMANNQITSKRLNVYKHIGQHLHKQFTLGMNALEIVAESDSLDIYKRALGRGKGEEVGNGYGRRIEFTDVVWSKVKGNPVDKPKGQNWVEEEISGDNYTLPADQKPMKIVIFEDETDPAKLLQKTYDWLINNNRPKLQLKTSVAEAGDLNLGDYVFVTRPDINLRYETRVFRIKRNLLNPKLTTVEFGDNIAITPMDKVTNVSNRVDIVDNKIDKVQEDISIVDSTGVKVNYGNSEPKDKKKGDIWFYTTEDGEEILLRWDGEKWVRVVDNKIIEEIETTVDNAMKESEQAKQDALNAVQKVDEAVQKVTETNEKLDQVNIEVDYVTNRVDAVDTNIGKINTDISSINSKVDELQIIQPNLIGTKDPMIQLKCYPNGATSSNNNGYAKFTGDCNGQEILPVSDIMLSKPQGTKITQQIEINTDGTLSALKFTFYNGSHNEVDATIIDKGNGTYIAHASWTFPNENNTRMIDIKSLTASGATYVQFRRPKVEEGEYTPYELSASEVDKVVSTVEQTASGLREQVQDNKGNILEVKKNMQGVQTTVQNNTGEISSLKQQANIMSSKIQDNKNNISKVTQTASNVQTQVSNLENKTNTKFTQIEDMIALQAQKDGLNYPQVSKMKDVQDLYELSDKQTWQDIYVFENTLEDGTLKYIIRVGNLGMSKGEKKGIRLKEYLDVTGASQFTLQFKSVLRANDTSCAKGYCYIVEYDENKRMLANNFNWIKYDYVDTEYTNTYKQVLNPDTKYVRPVYVFESTGKTFDFDLYDFFCYTNTSGLSAQVGIMTDNISLSVKKDEVINSINVSTEGVTIAGNKVHITGQTTIDNAVIKDAMISNISASKITAGTIDASKINVININANNIIGNKTQFVQSAWNSISSNVTISGNGIKAGSSGREVRLDSNGLNWKKSDGTGLAYFGNSWAIDKKMETLSWISEPGEYIGLAHRYGGETIATRYLTLEPSGRISFESGGKVGFGGKDAYFMTSVFNGNIWPSINGASKKAGVGFGNSALYLFDEKSYMSLNDIRVGKLQSLTFPDGRKLDLRSGTISGTNVGFITGVNDVGIAWSGGDLYFHNNYHNGWIKFEDILKKIKW